MSSNFYVLGIRNRGGLVLPVILKIDYADGTTEELRIPAEIWRKNSVAVEKLLVTSREITRLTLDPHGELSDTDTSNNVWPPQPAKSGASSSSRDSAQFRLNEDKEDRAILGDLQRLCRVFFQTLDLLKPCEHPQPPAHRIVFSPERKNRAEVCLQIPIFDLAHYADGAALRCRSF